MALAACGAGMALPVAGADAATPTASFLEDRIAIGGDTAGRDWYLGGFSALAPIGSSGKEYWTVTDRGPNDDADRAVAGAGLYCATKPSGKVVFLPGFVPEITKLGVQVKIQHGQ